MGIFGDGRVGIVHAIVVALCSLLLTQILLRNFRKIPFTCSYPPFGQSSVLLVLFYVMGFFAFVSLISHLEHWVLQSLVGTVVLIVAMAVACIVMPRVGHDEESIEDTLLFDETAPVAFDLLDLQKVARTGTLPVPRSSTRCQRQLQIPRSACDDKQKWPAV